MSAAAIQCVPALLDDLEARVRSLVNDLGGAVVRDFAQSGPVQHAHQAKCDKWRNSREEINTALTKIADTVRSIRETFVATDQQLSEALGHSPSSSGAMS